MARIIEGSTGQNAYHDVVTTVRALGRRRGSRNGGVIEVPDLTIALDSPLNALPIGVGRNLNPRIAAAEALQLIGGFSDPEWLVKISPGFARYSEPTGGFWGAYGIRVRNQLKHVVRKLNYDPDTRQAVIQLWSADLDNIEGKNDYPCTIAIGFTRFKDTIEMHVTMRSNDVWLGLPYDMFQFAQLQLTLCNILNLDPGRYTHTAWSSHLYVSNLDQSYEVTTDVDPDVREQPTGIGTAHTSVENVWFRASAIQQSAENARTTLNPTKSEEWYLDVIHRPNVVA